jgi:hypothetical protein
LTTYFGKGLVKVCQNWKIRLRIMLFHHISIKTADIFGAVSFYEALGFSMETRFTAGITLACWMMGANNMRLSRRLRLMDFWKKAMWAITIYHLRWKIWKYIYRI